MPIIALVHIISGDLWAGAEVMAFNLISEQTRMPDLNVSVICLNEGTLSQKLSDLSVDLTVIDESKLSFLQVLYKTRHKVSQISPEIIHSHRYKENILAFLASRGQGKIRLVATQHGMPEEGGKRSFIQKFVTVANRTMLRYSFDRIVGVSQNIWTYFNRDCGVPADKLQVIHNGIIMPEITVSHEWCQEIKVGSAGRLYPVKDYPLMVEIARAVNQIDPSVRFELVGEGPESKEIGKDISRYKLSDVFTLAGHCDDMGKFYDKISVYINTSRHEGIPMSILEAMGHGLPVVAPDVGGIGEIIDHGKDGFLVPERNPQAFSEFILELRDSNVREKIGKAARGKIERSFSAQSMADNYYNLYCKMMN